MGQQATHFTVKQKETARLALCWAEQYLYGYLDALGSNGKTERAVTTRQMNQIRKVRLEHFGQTSKEASIARCVTVPLGGAENFDSLLKFLHKVVVVCSNCKTMTNGRVAGDPCNTCKIGVFQPQ